MNISQGFHKRFPTDISSEISLARELDVSAKMRWGTVRLPRMLRTDPAAVCRLMKYGRLDGPYQGTWDFTIGMPWQDHTKPTNAEILTPSHPEWTEFQERLEAELVCPDFEEFYGPSQVVFHDSIETEYWPLCSAQLIARLGFAVAESLFVMLNFLGGTDGDIAKHVQEMWAKTPPSKRRPAFDALALGGPTSGGPAAHGPVDTDAAS